MARPNTFRAALVAGLLAVGAPLSAQLPQASAAALGIGNNTTASARGFAAVANNPAGLGRPDSPHFSLAVASLAVESGLGPVTLDDLVQWEGAVVPDPVKSAWLQSVTASGGQTGAVEAGVTPFALSLGRIGLQVSTYVGGQVTLNADAVELLFYGNAGVTGSPEDFDLEGSAMDGFALSTAAVSTGFRASEHLYLGVTGKYTMGNALLVGRDGGSLVRSSPASVELDFPVLVPNTDDMSLDNGSGVGFDVGAVWEGPGVTLGATVQNVVNTFEWRLDNFSYVAGQALFDTNSSESDFEEQPASAAPEAFQAVVAGLGLKPVLAVGAEITPSSLLSVRADVRKRVKGGLEVGPAFHAGVGAELHALSMLPLRAHMAVVSGGFQVGGGASLILGPMHLSVGAATRTSDAGHATLGMLSLTFGAS